MGHTKILLRDILSEIDEAFNHVFTVGTTGLAFMVTNPALYRIPARDQFEDLAVDAEDDDEADVEEEYD